MRLTVLLRSALLFCICVIGSSSLQGQLSGKYTIGGSASSRNFTNWYVFADSINKIGVNDTVWVSVLGDFVDTNAIVFKKHKSNPTSKKRPVFIQGNYHTIQISRWFESIFLDSIDNFFFKKLTIINNSPEEPICLRIGPESDFIIFDSCNFQINGLTKIPFKNYSAGYINYSTGSASCYIAIAHKIQNSLFHCFNSNQARAIRITNCLMETKNTNSPGPGCGIISKAWPMVEFAGTTNYYFANNRITNFCHKGLDIYHSVDDTIINNDISKIAASTSSPCVSQIHGISIQNCISNNSGLLISNNVIHDIPFRLSTSGGAASAVGIFRGFDIVNQSNRNNDIYRSYVMKNRIENIRSNNYFLGFWVYLDANDLKQNRVSDVSAIHFTGYQIDHSRNSTINENKISRVSMSNSQPGFFRGFNVYAYYTAKSDSFQIHHNTIDSNIANGDFFAFYQQNYSPGYDSFHINYRYNTVTNNGFHANKSSNVFHGFYLNDTANMNSYFTIIASNLIANNYNAGKVMMVYDSTRIQDTMNFMLIQQNTFQYDALKNTTPIYGYKSIVKGNHKLIGNIFDFSSDGNIYPIFLRGFKHFVKSNFNTYHLNSKSQKWTVSSSTFLDINSWCNSNYSDSSDKVDDPKFVNSAANNFQTSSTSLQNIVPSTFQNLLDVKGTKRTFPLSDIGAIESKSFDLALVKATYSRKDSACQGVSIEISAKIKNSSKDSLVIGTVAIKNGSSFQKIKINRLLKPSDSTTIIVSNSFILAHSGLNKILVYLDNFDDIPENDSQNFEIWIQSPPNRFEILPQLDTFTVGNKPIYCKTDIFPDTTIVNVPIAYAIKPGVGSGFSNSNWNSRWVTTVWPVDNIGQPVNGLTFFKPSGTNNAILKFTATDTALEGNTITIFIKIKDSYTGCDTIYSKRIYIAQVPRLKFNFIDTLCVGDTLKIVNNSEGGSGKFIYSWRLTNSIGVLIDSSNLRNPILFSKSRGIFILSFKLTDMQFGYTYQRADTVWFGLKPTVRFQNSKSCSNQLTQISNQTIPKTAVFTWDYSDKSVLSDSVINDSIFLIRNKIAGSFKLSLRADDWGCWDTISTIIIVHQTPIASFKADTVSCSNNSVNFKNTTQWLSNVGSYTWYLGELNKISRDTNPSYFYKSPGEKIVQLIVKTQMGCSDTFVRKLTIHQAPQICDFIYIPDYSYAYYGMKFTPADATGKPAGNPNELYTWTVNGKDTQTSSNPNYSVSMDLKRDGTLGIGMTSTTKGTSCSCYLYKLVVMDRTNTDKITQQNQEFYWYINADGQVMIQLGNQMEWSSWIPIGVYSAVGTLVSKEFTQNQEQYCLDKSIKSGVYYLRLMNGEGEIKTIAFVVP